MTSASSDCPVVFVHGLIGHLKPLAAHSMFARAGACAPDLLGYGAEVGVDPETITLAAQARELGRVVGNAYGDAPVHLVGHSVGGAIAMLFAAKAPERVASVTSVEGNFTLDDAFWSASLGRMTVDEVEALLGGMRADPEAWIARSVPSPSLELVALADEWLHWQPASTLRAMGRAVVAETGISIYLETVRSVFERLPVHLVAGERSRNGWHVPEWARLAAASEHVVPNAGHLPMVDDLDGFADRLASYLGLALPSSVERSI